MRQLLVQWDRGSDVLYVFFEQPGTVVSRQAPSDYGLILDHDASGAIVGVRLLDASASTSAWWRSHPDVDIVPAELRVAVDEWLRTTAFAAV